MAAPLPPFGRAGGAWAGCIARRVAALRGERQITAQSSKTNLRGGVGTPRSSEGGWSSPSAFAPSGLVRTRTRGFGRFSNIGTSYEHSVCGVLLKEIVSERRRFLGIARRRRLRPAPLRVISPAATARRVAPDPVRICCSDRPPAGRKGPQARARRVRLSARPRPARTGSDRVVPEWAPSSSSIARSRVPRSPAAGRGAPLTQAPCYRARRFGVMRWSSPVAPRSRPARRSRPRPR